jgi:hypothetical protein
VARKVCRFSHSFALIPGKLAIPESAFRIPVPNNYEVFHAERRRR